MNLTKSKLDIDEKFLYQYEGDKYLSDDKMPDYVNIIKLYNFVIFDIIE